MIRDICSSHRNRHGENHTSPQVYIYIYINILHIVCIIVT